MLISDLEYLVTMVENSTTLVGGARPRRQTSAAAFGNVNASALGRKSSETTSNVFLFAQADEFGSVSQSGVSGSATAKG